MTLTKTRDSIDDTQQSYTDKFDNKGLKIDQMDKKLAFLPPFTLAFLTRCGQKGEGWKVHLHILV